MKIEEEIVKAIDTTLKNPIYQTMKILGIKTILKNANFIKKREGVVKDISALFKPNYSSKASGSGIGLFEVHLRFTSFFIYFF